MGHPWLASLMIAALGAVASPAGAQALVRVDGSSTMFPLTEAVAQAFQVRARGKARITVGISGTRGGFRKFCRGETELAEASRPILTAEMEACRAAGVRYFELPVAFDALTIAVHPRNTWVDSLTVSELRRMWEPSAQGRVLRWNQIRPEWPDEPLVLFGAGADSGTFDYFTEAVIGRTGASRGDYIASEDDHVLVRGIENNPQALGYIPYAYYAARASHLKAVPIDTGAGPVEPALGNVLNGSYQPLSRPLFLYVNAEAAARGEVREFVEFLLTQGAPLIREVDYLPLSKQAYRLALGNFRAGKLGTAFNGRPEVGLDLQALLAREAKL